MISQGQKIKTQEKEWQKKILRLKGKSILGILTGHYKFVPVQRSQYFCSLSRVNVSSVSLEAS
jgi:hypothetical protein